ncbi:ketoacyl-ACP synthase III [Massilia sp. IC2-477]|uniref:ketoacyl-ACP synthase III n=1 Tax=Massilia sp. IC2-477 TaxID=2887198 RepID=UPI001D109254|nr:ketoacyl-ACP synthase III [Massilia sp. IC2-477]MCC2957058.1 ketoacyl-ACP synthase III [Massilia sp. IC2-477]
MSLSIGRENATTGARIAGVVSCVPSTIVTNEHFRESFGQEKIDEVAKMIGVQERRWAGESTTTRDLCRTAALHLMDRLEWDPATVDAVLFVSQTPDFRMPATACVLQADLGIGPACIAFDVNLGCSGYTYGLWLAMTMVQSGAARRVLLAVGETMSKIIDHNDRSTAMLFGDAGTVTAVEQGGPDEVAHFVLGSDGTGATNLIIPRGGFRDYSLSGDKRLDGRDPDCMYMDGGEVFVFTLQTVLALATRTMEFAAAKVDEYDGFLFHQANHFMLKQFAKKCKLPMDKVPVNIDRFGNTSSATIPLLLTTNMAQGLKQGRQKLAMFGFGVGYSWASASLSLGPLAVADLIEHNTHQ